ncbi:hypothetical protein W97_00077 [Coniosporium apollinis CBS 100218]|uniref:Uncharacterized protein n=1 Tax=Coniosporium apollinis (strain CBS 100218) TaxID=1168221 RepID=R7YG29_CONA1|nr:uncharacterized protein W97_00077 [Coniosporium apollinis CBS 100218]EON60867.1 hypothetical protein W97_00077 [Coniosporium apollinis CBS 100218]
MPDVEEPSQPRQKRTLSPDPESYSSVSTNIYSDVLSFKGAKEVFNIDDTFIRALLTSSEVRYQLSTTLDTPLRFEEDRALYTIHKDSSNSVVRVVGLESETRIDCIFKRWRMYHVTENKNIDMLDKVGQKGLEWEDEAGRVVAKETFHSGDRYDLWPYVLKLDADIDEKSTDLLVACWVDTRWYWGWDNSAVRL